MTKKLDLRLIEKLKSKIEFEKFIDSLPRYHTSSSNNVTFQFCSGKMHKMKQIYCLLRCTTKELFAIYQYKEHNCEKIELGKPKKKDYRIFPNSVDK